MKSKTLLLVLISGTVFMVGCDNRKTTGQQLDRTMDKTADVAQDMKDYTYAQKAEYTAKMRSDLVAINKSLDELEAKLENSSAAVQAERKPKIMALRAQAAGLSKQLDAINNATESTWDGMKAGTQKVYNELKDGFNATRQWVSDKIAP